MPYTAAQCRAFAAKAARGERVPADWKEHCRKDKPKKSTKRKVKKNVK